MSTVNTLIPKIDSSNDNAWKNVRVDPQQSLETALVNLTLSEESGYDEGIAWSNGIIGTSYAWISDYEKALEYCFLSVDQLRKTNQLEKEAEVQYTLSLIFFFLADYDKQRTYARKSLQIFEQLNDERGIAAAYNGIGTGFYSSKKYDEALEVLKKAELHAIKAGDKQIMARVYDGLGEAHLGLNNLESALENKRKSLEVSNELGSQQVLIFCHEAVGKIYKRLNEFDKALEHFEKALELKKASNFQLGIGFAKLRIGETLVDAQHKTRAIEVLNQVIEIGEELNSNELLYRAHLGFSKLYDEDESIKKHLTHLKSYYKHKELYNAETQSKKIKDFKLRSKLEQVQEEKELLLNKNENLKKAFDDVKILSSIGNEITSTLDLESIFNIIYERINGLMQAQGIFVGVCNYEKNELNVPLAIDRGARDKFFKYSLNDAGKHLPVYAVKKDTPIHINDYSQEISKYLPGQEEVINDQAESVILIPLKVKEEVIGVLLVQNEHKNAFSDHHFNLLTTFASYLSIALDNAFLYGNMENRVKARTEELKTSYDNSELLTKIGQELISTLNFEDVFETLYENVNQLMDATIFGVRLLNKENETVDYKYEYEKGNRLEGITVPMSNMNNYSVWCITKNKEIFITDHENDYKKYVDEIMVVDGDFPYSLIFYPLRDGKEVLGCISIQCFDKQAYTQYHLSIVKTLAQYTTIALLNARRYEQMEDQVKERTEQISRSYENAKLLSEVGKNITSQLSVENIIETAYSNINKLMDAEGFGIGIFHENSNTIVFPGYIESGERLKASTYELEDNNRLACVCFNQELEIVINDFDNEYSKYIDVYVEPQVGKSVTSLIYLPIRFKEKLIGAITVQSFEKDSYQDYQVDMLRSIGVYAGIALDNASLYENMEEIVKRRTDEVVKQKEQIEESYQNTKLVAQINSDISKSITIESIISSVYENVNNLMDAACFGIGIFDADKNSIRMPGFIENGIKMDDFYYSLDDQRLASWCFLNQKEINISDYSKEYKDYIAGLQAPVAGQDSTSIVYIPLFSKEKIVGLLTVQSFKTNAFNEYHLDILRGLAATIASAIENATLYENLEEKVKERTSEVVKQKEQIEKTAENTRLISAIGKEISSKLNSADIISDAYQSINDIMDASIFGIGMYKEETNTLRFSGAIEKGEKLNEFDYSLDDVRIATKCFKEHNEFVINNWDVEYIDYVADKNYKIQEGERPVSMIYLPLISKDQAIGVMSVQSFEENSYGEYELNILRTLSLYVASALENANLYENMEKRVIERTAEIQKTYSDTKLLSQLSKSIAESLEVDSIISKVYEGIKDILDATCFGIGIYEEEGNRLFIPGFIEKGIQLENVYVPLDGPQRMATICFQESREIFIKDLFNEYHKYIKDMVPPVQGKDTTSIIYLPLITSEKTIGFITVQSFKKEAYTEYQSSLLRNLATTIATAIDNATLYESLEEKVKERTQEVVKQKEEVEKAFKSTKLLSQIGNEITSVLSSKEIISKVYTNVNNLMDASVFGIGLYREKENDLHFAGLIERGKKFDDFSYNLDDDVIAALCFRDAKEIIINDWNKEHQQYIEQDYEANEGEEPESMIYLPLISKGNRIGVITVQSFKTHSYSTNHVAILKSMSVYIASALENASLYQDMENRVKKRTAEIEKAHDDTKLISQISRDVVESLEVETIISSAYNNINSLLDATCFGIGIHDKVNEKLIFPGFIEKGREIENLEFKLDGDFLASNCFNQNKEIIIHDYNKEFGNFLDQDVEVTEGEETNSIVYFPLNAKEKVIGVLTVQSYKTNAYTDYHLNILRSLATTIATAIDNAVLYESLEEKVKERTLEILEQKEIIEETNKHLTDSIRYAKRIQDATLPDYRLVESYLNEAFVLFKPKDIVSGDFYWLERVGNKVLFAVVDCTGHGVPGAFLSLIGHNSLNQIVNELGIIKPADILNNLNKILHNTLKSGVTEDHTIRDGMDLTICCLDVDSNKLEFAGANNPIYLIKNSELTEIKGDKVAIGADLGKQSYAYTNHEIQLDEGDTIYLFSDGYADQFGGPRGKKLKYKAFKEILVDIHQQKMEDQHKILNDRIMAWQGDLEQIDDVCILGVKV